MYVHGPSQLAKSEYALMLVRLHRAVQPCAWNSHTSSAVVPAAVNSWRKLQPPTWQVMWGALQAQALQVVPRWQPQPWTALKVADLVGLQSAPGSHVSHACRHERSVPLAFLGAVCLALLYNYPMLMTPGNQRTALLSCSCCCGARPPAKPMHAVPDVQGSHMWQQTICDMWSGGLAHARPACEHSGA